MSYKNEKKVIFYRMYVKLKAHKRKKQIICTVQMNFMLGKIIRFTDEGRQHIGSSESNSAVHIPTSARIRKTTPEIVKPLEKLFQESKLEAQSDLNTSNLNISIFNIEITAPLLAFCPPCFQTQKLIYFVSFKNSRLIFRLIFSNLVVI